MAETLIQPDLECKQETWQHVPSGYRCSVETGSVSVLLPPSNPLSAKLNWQNYSIAMEQWCDIKKRIGSIMGHDFWVSCYQPDHLPGKHFPGEIVSFNPGTASPNRLRSLCNELAHRLYARYGEDLWPE